MEGASKASEETPVGKHFQVNIVNIVNILKEEAEHTDQSIINMNKR